MLCGIVTPKNKVSKSVMIGGRWMGGGVKFFLLRNAIRWSAKCNYALLGGWVVKNLKKLRDVICERPPMKNDKIDFSIFFFH